MNPVPVTFTLETVTFEFPLLVSVTFDEPVAPRFTFPKLTELGLAPNSSVAATPDPLKEMLKGEAGALLTSEIEPDALPVELGENTALNEAVFPGVRVNGTVKPVKLKPAPDAVA